ncbi:hypothetical protein QJS10_CPB20g02036 [Acorus calamus]|uniref:Dehydrin n=1 Tax=Acorus calamus TaxID=4465 RepID=A0AAV9CA24_ACOCL|nr:hypothetical protein QJS10_CPB20g02036 [Acorus calamus]
MSNESTHGRNHCAPRSALESHNTRDGSFEVIQTDELVRTENYGCPEKKHHGFITDVKEKFEEVKEKIIV